MEAKPADGVEYIEWLKKRHSIIVDGRMEKYYDTVVESVARDFGDSAFWRIFVAELPEYDSQYLIARTYHLLLTETAPQLQTKPFESFMNKTYRKNVLDNPNWPEPPGDGWVLPDNWFAKTNDVVRTLVVVKYLDGVEFLVAKLKELSGKHGVECTTSLEAREEGYYAAHVQLISEFEVPGMDWDTVRKRVPVEIQITSQLQDLMRQLLHKFYSERRCKPRLPEVVWQWNYRSDEFAASYLAHILHYVEAMIVEVRDRQNWEAGK